jgi:hypothetical protein
LKLAGTEGPVASGFERGVVVKVPRFVAPASRASSQLEKVLPHTTLKLRAKENPPKRVFLLLHHTYRNYISGMV